MTTNAATDDAHEGISAFLEKRSPTWTGRCAPSRARTCPTARSAPRRDRTPDLAFPKTGINRLINPR